MADKTSLFSISCDTCAARLTVRSESAIGQVLACPRCGSMVMVEPPEGWVAPETDPLPPLPRRPRDMNDSQATLSTEFESLGPEIESPRPRTGPVQRKPLAPPVQKPGSGPILPDGKWDSERAVERRKTMTWIVAIISVCLVALAAIVWMIVSMTGAGDGSQTADNNDSNPVSLDDAVTKSKLEPDPATDPVPDIDPATKDPEPKNNDPEKTSENGSDPETGNSNTDENSNTPPVSQNPPDDPLVEIDPSNDALPPGDAMTLEDGALQKSFIDEVGPLEDLFTDPGIGVAINDFGEYRQDSLIGLGNIFVPRPRALNLDFEKQLGEVYPELQVDQVSLMEFVRILNLITGIPIQFDAHSVVYGHLLPMEKITWSGTDKSLVDIINEALRELNLVAIPDPNDKLVMIAFKDNDVIAARKFSLDPVLAGDDAQRGLLVELIKITTGPDRWTLENVPLRFEVGETEVALESTGILYDEVRFLLDRLAAAARLNANPDDVAAQEAARSFWTKSAAVFEAEGKVNEIQMQPVNQIMNQVAENESLVVIPDWRSLQAEGWNSDTQMPWPGEGESVEETLTNITSSMGLAWRLLGPAMVEITSKEMYRNGTRCEVYPCAPVLKKYSVEQVMSVLQTQLSSEVQKTKSWTRVDYYPACNCIVATLPDPLQIRLEVILTELAR